MKIAGALDCSEATEEALDYSFDLAEKHYSEIVL